MTSLRWPVSSSSLPQPLGDAELAEFAALVRPLGPREAARRMRCSPGHIVNICKGRRQLFLHLLARAKGSLRDRDQGQAGYVRLLSGADYRRIYGREYPYKADDDDDGWGIE